MDREGVGDSCEREQWLPCPQSQTGVWLRVWWWREGVLGGHCPHRVRPSVCFSFSSYIGSRVTSNMVIIEVSLLSGFVMTSRSRTLVRTLELKKPSCGKLIVPAYSCWELLISGQEVAKFAEDLCCCNCTKSSCFLTAPTREIRGGSASPTDYLDLGWNKAYCWVC